MIFTDDWTRKSLNVTADLRLDPANVRIQMPVDAPQADIIQDLFQNEDVLSMAKEIATVGFLTHELPIVIREGEQWIVAEGNRRVAALKALLNPNLVPGSRAALANLNPSDELLEHIRHIQVMVAPDRDQVNQVVANLHTRNPRRPWRPLRQAEFFYAQVIAGKTVQELVSEYQSIDVASFIKMAEMHKSIKDVEYDDKDLRQYVHRKNFPISTFDRLYSNPEFLSLAKLDVDSQTGRVSFRGHRDDFKALATKIASDMQGGRINTRVLNKPGLQTYDAYFGSLRNLAVRDIGVRSAVQDQQEPSNADNVQGQRRRPATLNTSGLTPIAGFPSIDRILTELGQLPYSRFPNATFDLMRTFLEKTIKAFAANQNVEIPRRSKSKHVQLYDALVWLQHKFETEELDDLKQSVSTLLTQQSYNFFFETKEYLDAANHNPHIFIDSQHVVGLWESMAGIIRYLLRPQYDA